MAASKAAHLLRRIAPLTPVPGPTTASQTAAIFPAARLVIHSFCSFFKNLDRAFLYVALRAVGMLLRTKTIDSAAAHHDQPQRQFTA